LARQRRLSGRQVSGILGTLASIIRQSGLPRRLFEAE
jgi:hypothetical protein